MKSKLMKLSTLLLFLVLSFATFTSANAQEGDEPKPPTDDAVNAIAKDMFCPVCENVPLDVCPTVACQQWRDEIRDKLAEGWSEEQIQQYFVDRFGPRVLAEPPREGFSWLVYVVPPAAILVAAFFLYNAMQAWRSAASVSTPVFTPLDREYEDKYVELLEEELQKRMESL